jgi:hypothetical protein
LVARIYDEGKSERSVPLERVKGGSSEEGMMGLVVAVTVRR